MEEWVFDPHAGDLLGEDFLDLLSQPLEYYAFDYSTEQYLYQGPDWYELQDLTGVSPAENNPEFGAPLPERNQTAPENSQLFKDSSCNTASKPSSPLEDQRGPRLSRTLETINFEDCVSEFSVAQAGDKITRRRKRFSNERRKEVDHIRKVGACIRCRLMKTACKLELPCAGCTKACYDITLSRTLCTRQKLTDIRFSADLWDQKEDLAWLTEEVHTIFGPRKTLSISLTAFCDANSLLFDTDKESQIWASGGHDGPWTIANPLEIVIQDFEPTAGREYRHVFDPDPTENPGEESTAPQFYAIPTDSLPNLETLEAWALETARNHPRAFFGPLRGPFLTLARRYCDCKKPLPLQDLMRKVVRMTCLHGIWRSELPRPRGSSQQSHQYVSNAVHIQIGVIVGQGIVEAEVEILSLLQKHIFSQKGPGRRNMLPIWTCLWILILMYRETLYCYDNSGRQSEFYQLGQHMYNILVSVYSGLFRPSSPLWLNWLRDDIYELFGRDWRIIEAMGTLKTEIGQYANGETLADMDFLSRDSLLQSLIFDQEKKLEKKLTEKPLIQDPTIEIHLSSFEPNYFVVEEDLVRPKMVHGLDQHNRLSVIKETSLGANGWARWPPSLY